MDISTCLRESTIVLDIKASNKPEILKCPADVFAESALR